MELEECIEKVWKEKLREELFENHNYLLWEEAGIAGLMFTHLRGCLDDYGKRTLIVPEYRPTAPRSIRCELHKDVIKRYKGKEKWKVDLSIVRFKEDLDRVKIGKECSLWCFEHKPVVAMEFKYMDYYILKSTLKEELKRDINKLRTMIEKWNTEIAYLCVITDVENEQEYNDLLNFLKDLIKGKSKEKFRIAIGSWENPKLWNVEKMVVSL